MIRLILRLLNIRDYEVCQSCETLKQQLNFANEEKKQLTETLLNIIKPKVYEAPSQEIVPIVQAGGLFSRRRAALEARDREQAKILQEAKHLGKPDNLKDISKLEEGLGIEEEGVESNG